MKISNLKLINFRNYSKLELNFNSGINIIYGNNGSGKTNLVESIYVLALTKSFRTIQDKNIIMQNKDVLKVEGFIKSNETNSYKVIINQEGKKVKINNNKINKISDYISKINIIIFSPDEMKIIKDSPNIRRKMLNISISQLNKEYLKYLNNYNKILKQRNSYLKQAFINGNSSTDYLNILTSKLIDYGLLIYQKRYEYVIELNNYINEKYKCIASSGDLEIKYNSDYLNKTKDEIIKKYKSVLNKEMSFGKTLIGVHHDDLEFYLNKNKLKDWGSEGQQKNAVIALKLSEIEIVKNKIKDEPILILDDIFSELDINKINNILNLLDNKSQVFITTTDLNKISNSILKNSKILHVIDGIVEEEDVNGK